MSRITHSIATACDSRTQTLTSLTHCNLRDNEIGDVGAERLATALRENEVTLIEICSDLVATHFTRPHRHSHRSTCSWNQIGDVGRVVLNELKKRHPAPASVSLMESSSLRLHGMIIARANGWGNALRNKSMTQ